MKTQPDNYTIENNQSVLSPRYVLALSFDDDNTDITYLTSHSDCEVPAGTAAIDRIDSVIKSISGQTQRITPERAQHTIGSITVSVLDPVQTVSTKINTKLTGGEGLRKKRIQLYKGFDGLTTWDDYSLQFTYFVEGVSFKNNVYTLQLSDIQRTAKTDIFERHEAVLTSDLAAAATTINVTAADALNKFPLLYHDARYSAQTNQAVGYIKIDDEIICHSGWNTAGTQLNVVARGALNTLDVAHENKAGATEDEEKKRIEEYIFIEGASPRMIYSILSGLDIGGKNLIPDPFDISTFDLIQTPVVTVSINESPVGWGDVYNIEDNHATNWEAVRVDISSGYTSGEIWSTSILVKHDAAHSVQVGLRLLFLGDGDDDYTTINVNLSTGVVSTAATTDVTIDSSDAENINGWWFIRIAAHYTGAGSTTAARMIFYPAYAAAASTGNADVFAPFLGKGDVQGWSFLPDHWHLSIPETYIEHDNFTDIGLSFWNPETNEGRIARFLGVESQNGKDFIESELLLWLGAFLPVRSNGAYGIQLLQSVLPYTDSVDHITASGIIDYGPLQYDQKSVTNNFSIKWNWVDHLQRFLKINNLIDSTSIGKYGKAPKKVFELKGVFTGVHTDTDIQNYFNQLRDRYAAPPLNLKLTVMPQFDRLEVGDTVRVDCASIWDYYANESLSRVFEIQQSQIDWITGKVILTLFGGVEQASRTAISTTNVMQDSFYNSSGTELSTVLTISGGAVTANGTLSGGVYYYLGDLTINAGVTVTCSDHCEFRIRGTLTINGKIDGSNNGEAGAASSGSQYGTNGTVGGVGQLATRKIPGVTISEANFSLGTNIIWLSTGGDTFSQDAQLSLENIINPDGAALTGLPASLNGSGGGSGNASGRLSSTFVFTKIADGGAGGDGGAGMIFILRGIAFGVSGKVQSNGANGGANGSGTYSGRTLNAGQGKGGSAGGVMVLIDGNGSTPSIANFELLRGTVPPHFPALDKYPGMNGWFVPVFLASGETGGVDVSFWTDGSFQDMRETNLSIGYIPKALDGFTWYPADEESNSVGYGNKPPAWADVVDDGFKPVNNATANDTDANLKDRTNHTGTQTMSTVSDAGNLAVKDTVDTAEIDADAVTNNELATGAVTDDSILNGTQITQAGISTSTTGQRIVITESGDELEFYGDRGDATVSQIGSIGIAGISGTDDTIADFGGSGSGYTKDAIKGQSYSGNAVWGVCYNTGGVGVAAGASSGGTAISAGVGAGDGNDAVGLKIELTNFGTNYTNRHHLLLVPHPDVTGAPSASDGSNGSLVVESGGDLYFKKGGAWQKLST